MKAPLRIEEREGMLRVIDADGRVQLDQTTSPARRSDVGALVAEVNRLSELVEQAFKADRLAELLDILGVDVLPVLREIGFGAELACDCGRCGAKREDAAAELKLVLGRLTRRPGRSG